MIIVFDIGNSNIVIGLFKNNLLIHKWRLISDGQKSCDDYAIDIIELCLTSKVDCLDINGCIIASVVPVLTSRIQNAVKKFTNENVEKNTYIIGDEKTKLNIEVKIKNKNEVGHDRLVNAIAGYNIFGDSLTIVDFGTATTFDIVGKNGEYLGGIITAGVNMSLKSLHNMTAQLPKISLKNQNHVIGKSTVEAMISGVYHGNIAMIEGMFSKIDNELGYKTKKIITGGIGEIFKTALTPIIDHFDSDLTLNGLLIIYNLNQNIHKSIKSKI